ncbi:MAG: tetratricopeptide repeat protein, partial [Alphaproteobacteria bacterium]|nr:tetratricopeptide repeat protein [Alphaproteobacteria bacterium]
MADGASLQDVLVAAAAAVKAGDFSAAASAFREADALAPNQPSILGNLAAAVARSEGIKESIPWLIKRANCDPRDVAAQATAGLMLAHVGRTEDAEPYLNAALALDSGDAQALEGAGLVADARGDIATARQLFARALDREPSRPEALFRLGLIALRDGDCANALRNIEAALRVAPRETRYLVNAGTALDMMARPAAARRRFDEALGIDPGNALIWSNKLMAAAYDPALSATALADLHRQYDQLFPVSLRRDAPRHSIAARPIRIGYVSADFRSHVGASQLLALIRAHDRTAFNITCYVANAASDHVTAELRGLVDHWRPIYDLNDDAAAAAIWADGIDILIDVAGHSDGSRLGIFARTPAPVMVSLPGYIATTGLSAIQYRITDSISDPTEADQAHYVERLVRLPEGHFCYEPLVTLPSVSVRPADGPVVFGSFHNRRKYNDGVVEVWAGILARVPRSRLILKDRQFDHQSAREDVAGQFSVLGVERSRLEFLGYAPSLDAHYRAYA